MSKNHRNPFGSWGGKWAFVVGTGFLLLAFLYLVYRLAVGDDSVQFMTGFFGFLLGLGIYLWSQGLAQRDQSILYEHQSRILTRVDEIHVNLEYYRKEFEPVAAIVGRELVGIRELIREIRADVRRLRAPTDPEPTNG